MKYKARLHKYRCKSCNSVFKDYSVGGKDYGSIPLRSNKRRFYVFVGILENGEYHKIYQEYKDIEKELFDHDLGKMESAKYFNKMFQVTCDQHSEEDPLKVNGLPKCKKCGSSKTSYVYPDLDSKEEKEIAEPTHESWVKLSRDEKCELIRKEYEKAELR